MNILDQIVEHKQRAVAGLPPRTVTPKELKHVLETRGDPRDFAGALQRPRAGKLALIAEIKQASPSAGLICPDFDPVRIAREYEAAGASCISVLTEEKFFRGSLDHLRQVRKAVKLPLLRKDFILDPRQVLESAESGADAILLIVAILTDDSLKELHALAVEAGLAVLVEVHNELELDRALSAGARLVGVNNRDLKTFNVDLATAERLAAQLRRSAGGRQKALIAESGIRARADVERLIRCGAQAMLVGEALMRHGDIRAKVAELLDITVP